MPRGSSGASRDRLNRQAADALSGHRPPPPCAPTARTCAARRGRPRVFRRRIGRGATCHTARLAIRRRKPGDRLVPPHERDRGRKPNPQNDAGGPKAASASGEPETRRAADCSTANYLMILATTPAPTVRPPSRIAKRRPSSIATGLISCTTILMLSPGMTISTPSGRVTAPVMSVVRK